MFVVTTLLSPLFLHACSCSPQYPKLGVWWWNKDLDDSYLDFAYQNKVTEIYYCNSNFDSNTIDFLSKCNKKNISVYLLAGEKEWLNNTENLINIIEKYIQFQSSSKIKFSGIHLDIEPHQFDDFSENRYKYIYNLINIAHTLKTNYRDILFDYDIPFWLEDNINFNNNNKPAYQHMIDIANRVFVMSYRDTAESIYNVGKEEVEYAISSNKQLFLCVETKSSEGDNVSFMEEGKEYMFSEIDKLRKLLPDNFGISIHHIKSWEEM